MCEHECLHVLEPLQCIKAFIVEAFPFWLYSMYSWRLLWMGFFFQGSLAWRFYLYIEKLLICLCWICILLCQKHWMFVICKCFLMVPLGSFMHRIMSSPNEDKLTSSFPICITFISLSSLIAWAKTSSTALSKIGAWPCFVSLLIYWEMLWCFNTACRFVVCRFY